MLTRVCLSLALLIATAVWSQVDTNGTEPASPTNDSAMLTPPPVSGQAYPNDTSFRIPIQLPALWAYLQYCV